jgi:hypothetical protein
MLGNAALGESQKSMLPALLRPYAMLPGKFRLVAWGPNEHREEKVYDTENSIAYL